MRGKGDLIREITAALADGKPAWAADIHRRLAATAPTSLGGVVHCLRSYPDRFVQNVPRGPYVLREQSPESQPVVRARRGQLVSEIVAAIEKLGGQARVSDIHREVGRSSPENISQCIARNRDRFQQDVPRGPYRVNPVEPEPPPEPEPAAAGRPAGPTVIAKPQRRRWGQLTGQIETYLGQHGPHGMTEIAIALGTTPQSIHSSIKAHADRFYQEKFHGPYGLRDRPAAGLLALPEAPAPAAPGTNGHTRDFMTEDCLPGGDHAWLRESQLFGRCQRCGWQRFYAPVSARAPHKMPGHGLVITAAKR